MKLLAFAALLLAHVAAALGSQGPNHQGIAMHRRRSVNLTLEKRVTNSKWSNYNTETGNAGSCGRFLKNSDFVVARSAQDYNPAECGSVVTLIYQGRTAQAIISDKCQKCPSGGLDLSMGLFKFIAPQGDGVVFGEWHMGADEPPPPPKPTPTPPPPPKTSSTTTKHLSTTSARPTSSTTATSSSSTSTSETTSTSASSAAETPTPTPIAATLTTTGNVQALELLFVGLGNVAVAAITT